MKRKFKVGDVVTVKAPVLSYESVECPRIVGEVYLMPGERATIESLNVPYVRKNATFTFVRWQKDGKGFRTGIPNDLIEVWS